MRKRLYVWGLYLGEKQLLEPKNLILGNTMCIIHENNEEADIEEIEKRILDNLRKHNENIANEIHLENLVILNVIDIK